MQVGFISIFPSLLSVPGQSRLECTIPAWNVTGFFLSIIFNIIFFVRGCGVGESQGDPFCNSLKNTYSAEHNGMMKGEDTLNSLKQQKTFKFLDTTLPQAHPNLFLFIYLYMLTKPDSILFIDLQNKVIPSPTKNCHIHSQNPSWALRNIFMLPTKMKRSILKN